MTTAMNVSTTRTVDSSKYRMVPRWAAACLLLLVAFVLPAHPLHAQGGGGGQQTELLLRGGHVIDPLNQIDGVMDVSIVGGTIARVAPNITPSAGANVIDVGGLYVTPGLIDIHTHVFWGTDPGSVNYSNGRYALPPDGFTLRAGVTTVVDAGGAGWRNFETFKEQTIDSAVTRVLAALNISGGGMDGSPNEGGNLEDMDARKTGEMGNRYPDIIVGVKHAHWGRNNPVPPPDRDDPTPLKRAIEAAAIMDGYFMLDGTFSEDTEPLFRPGDVYTHAFTRSLVDSTGNLQTFVVDAQRRGVVFDVGHGGGAFKFANAIPAIKLGFLPNTISSDLHTSSMNSAMKDMSNLMSKFMAMGLSLQEVVARSTWAPATVIKRPDLGNLSVGAPADVAVFSLRTGDFGFMDTSRTKIKGTQLLTAEMTLRDGRVVWDLNGRAVPMAEEQPGR